MVRTEGREEGGEGGEGRKKRMKLRWVTSSTCRLRTVLSGFRYHLYLTSPSPCPPYLKAISVNSLITRSRRTRSARTKATMRRLNCDHFHHISPTEHDQSNWWSVANPIVRKDLLFCQVKNRSAREDNIVDVAIVASCQSHFLNLWKLTCVCVCVLALTKTFFFSFFKLTFSSKQWKTLQN